MTSTRLIARLDVKAPFLIKGIHLEGLRKLGDPAEYAKKYEMVMVVPVYERAAPGVYYNTAAVIDADAQRVAGIRIRHAHETARQAVVGRRRKGPVVVGNMRRRRSQGMLCRLFSEAKNPAVQGHREELSAGGQKTLHVAIDRMSPADARRARRDGNGGR